MQRQTGSLSSHLGRSFLLDNLGAACEKLEQAVVSAGPNDRDALRDTVSLMREQFARIRGQLDTGAPRHIKCSDPRLGK